MSAGTGGPGFARAQANPGPQGWLLTAYFLTVGVTGADREPRKFPLYDPVMEYFPAGISALDDGIQRRHDTIPLRGITRPGRPNQLLSASLPGIRFATARLPRSTQYEFHVRCFFTTTTADGGSLC